jgi:eukaryotic-like serine/threonine-protein kinase
MCPDEIVSQARKVCLVCHAEFPVDQRKCPRDETVLVALAPDPYTGKTIAETYYVEQLIGTGGTSVVYKAQHLKLRRPAAIKMMKAHLVADEESKKRFEQEARAVSCLTHPHVITVYDVGVTNYGEPYIVMEYLQGKSLAEVIAYEKRLSMRRAVRLFIKACSALSHAHKKEVVHRDVKPTNIMLIHTDEDPEYVKLVDFGMAKLRTLTGEFQRLTKTGEVFGSPIYMCPEQCTGKKVDYRADIYAMGVVMFEALSGRPPFKEKTTIDTIRKHIKDPPPGFKEIDPTLNIPEDLQAIIFKALSKSPDDRQQSMDQLREELELFMANEAAGISSLNSLVHAVPTVTPSQAIKQQRAEPGVPKKLLIAAFVILTLLVLVLLLLHK